MPINKFAAVKSYLRGIKNVADIIPLHNNYCERNLYFNSMIYPMDEEHINTFLTPYSLFKRIKNSTSFHIDALYFYMPEESINTNIGNVIDYDALANFLIDWGDSGYNFDITGHLAEAFKGYAHEIVADRYTQEEVAAKVEECTDDFLMDDWDDIVKDLFDIVTFCPKCGATIYYDSNIMEYVYETGRTVYECPDCEEEVLV